MNVFTKDLVERVIGTFAVTFLSMVTVTSTLFGASGLATLEHAAVAGIASALTVLKGALAKRYGNPNSASLSSKV